MMFPDFTSALRLGGRQLWRDLRAGELRLLMLSVALAVAALTAVGFLADRLQSGLWRDARQLLGGDAVVDHVVRGRQRVVTAWVGDGPQPSAGQADPAGDGQSATG